MPSPPPPPAPPTLTLTVSDRGNAVDKNPWRFEVGPPHNNVVIIVHNDDKTAPHLVEMVKIKHVKTGHDIDPLTGRKSWLVPPGLSLPPSNHQVKDKTGAPEGLYTYVIRLDNQDRTDPEIAVDPPFDPGDPKRQTTPTKRAKPARKSGKERSAIRKAAKRKAAKKKAARKKARRGYQRRAGRHAYFLRQRWMRRLRPISAV